MYFSSKTYWFVIIIIQIHQIFGKETSTPKKLSEECQNWPFANQSKTQLNENIQEYSNAKPPTSKEVPVVSKLIKSFCVGYIFVRYDIIVERNCF